MIYFMRYNDVKSFLSVCCVAIRLSKDRKRRDFTSSCYFDRSFPWIESEILSTLTTTGIFLTHFISSTRIYIWYVCVPFLTYMNISLLGLLSQRVTTWNTGWWNVLHSKTTKISTQYAVKERRFNETLCHPWVDYKTTPLLTLGVRRLLKIF